MRARLYGTALCILCYLVLVFGHQTAAQGSPPVDTYRVVKAYPHDTSAYTQGLIYRDGFLYESTGLNGRSTLRKVRLETGEVVQERRLKVTHFSPLSGEEDAPENYHTLVYELTENNGTTRVSLSQDNNSSEEAAEHSKSNWEKMLAGLKDVVEG